MEKLIVIDGNALAHRGYHALPELNAPDGRLVNAVYGFFLVFLRAVSDLDADYVCACFDRPEPTFRHKKFKDYKAQRPKTPDNLIAQLSILKRVLKEMGVPIFEEPGYEADDLIATIVAETNSENRELERVIVTGDLDALQLVAPGVKAYILGRGVKDATIYDEQKVRERYGLSPALLADYRGLKGDVSDNIPGVPGIGPKTAVKLLQEFGSLEGVYEAVGQDKDRTEKGNIGIDEGEKGEKGGLPIGRRGYGKNKRQLRQGGDRLKEKLIEYKEQAFLSRDLARMRKDTPIEFNINYCCLKNYNKEKAESVFKELGFKTLISRLPGNQRKQRSLI